MRFLKKNKKQKEEPISSQVELGTLYEVNKSIIENNIEALTEEEMQNKKQIVREFINETNNNYYMLLCNENKDYTIFHRHRKSENGEFLDLSEGYEGEILENVLIDECLVNRGKTKSISLTETKDAIEIWISINGDSYVFYFFPYDAAIIEC